MRFRHIARAVDAVRVDAGFAMCGVALLVDLVDSGDIVPVFPWSTGRRSTHGFVARFRAPWNPSSHIARFRSWLAAESRPGEQWLTDLETASANTAS
jgi:LysR family glycine cleavage system transcriptional activator